MTSFAETFERFDYSSSLPYILCPSTIFMYPHGSNIRRHSYNNNVVLINYPPAYKRYTAEL
jgi:hypothetical protein